MLLQTTNTVSVLEVATLSEIAVSVTISSTGIGSDPQLQLHLGCCHCLCVLLQMCRGAGVH
jgi:hypothetical protein